MNRDTLADVPPIGTTELHQDRISFSNVAEGEYSGAGWTVHQWWRRLNKKHFGRQMSHCKIEFDVVPGEKYGLWKKEKRIILLSPSLLQRDGSRWWFHHWDLGSRFPPDVLLRQVTLQYIEEVRGGQIDVGAVSADGLSENEWWTSEIQRLSEELGLTHPTPRSSTTGGKSSSPRRRSRRLGFDFP